MINQIEDPITLPDAMKPITEKKVCICRIIDLFVDTSNLIVFESVVRSGCWVLSDSNQDQEWLVLAQKPKITGLNQCKLVIVG